MRFSPLATGFALSLATTAALAAKDVTVKVAWDEGEIKDAKMELFELKADAELPLWTTGAVAKRKELPVGAAIKGQTFKMPTGGTKKMVLVMENKGKKDLYFFASPHTVEPVKHSLGFDSRCLCLNHAYHAPAGKTWYRVVELRLDPDFSGKEVEVNHALVAVSKKRAEANQTKGAVVDPPPAD